MTATLPNPDLRPGRPRDARLDGAIVQATVDLIEERGYGELTLAAIASRAGTTTPAIYRRWSSKADLVLHAVFRTGGDDVVADTGELEADLSTMVRWTLEKFGQPVGRAALAGLLSEPLGAPTERLAQLGVVWRRIGARLATAIDAGEIRADVDTEALISLTAGAGMFVALLHADETIDNVRIDTLVSLIMDGIRPQVPGAPRGSPGSDR
jgi:AcrR family transcriptional regulator